MGNCDDLDLILQFVIENEVGILSQQPHAQSLLSLIAWIGFRPGGNGSEGFLKIANEPGGDCVTDRFIPEPSLGCFDLGFFAKSHAFRHVCRIFSTASSFRER